MTRSVELGPAPASRDPLVIYSPAPTANSMRPPPVASWPDAGPGDGAPVVSPTVRRAAGIPSTVASRSRLASPGYLGGDDAMDEAIARFASAYADETERGHQGWTKA